MPFKPVRVDEGITRVEVIDETGREYVFYNEPGHTSVVKQVLQDDGRTLKLFVEGWKRGVPRCVKCGVNAADPCLKLVHPTDESKDGHACGNCWMGRQHEDSREWDEYLT